MFFKNYRFKKYLALCLTILCFAFCGCTERQSSANGDIRIICTAFPQYDWVKQLTTGIENVSVEYLLKNGTDVHSFQPSAEDIVKINSCDLLVATGGTSDKSILETVRRNDNSTDIVFNMMSTLPEGTLLLTTHDAHDESDNHNHTHSEAEYDEHIWLSLKNAEIICSNLSDRLCTLLPKNADIIKSNTDSYLNELKNLDDFYSIEFSKLKDRHIVVADRFPFVYLAKDYSIECFKAFDGCSSDTDVSVDKILELSSAVDTYNIRSILVLKGGSSDIADAVKSNTSKKDQIIASVDTLQSVSSEDIENGITYLSAMQNTLDTIYNAANQ